MCPRYMCILLYMKLIQCSGVPQMYGQWEERGIYMCPRYMCILLYVKFIWCSSVPQIYGRLQEGFMSALGICVFFYV